MERRWSTLDVADQNNLEWVPKRRYQMIFLFLFYYVASITDLLSFFILVPALNPDGPTFDNRERKPYFGWHLMYLTQVGGMFQTIYFFFSLVDLHIFHANQKTKNSKNGNNSESVSSSVDCCIRCCSPSTSISNPNIDKALGEGEGKRRERDEELAIGSINHNKRCVSHRCSPSLFHFHRNRCFALAFAVGNFIGIMYFSIIFPGEVKKGKSFTIFNELPLSIMEHGVTTVFIWLELFAVKHLYAPVSLHPQDKLVLIRSQDDESKDTNLAVRNEIEKGAVRREISVIVVFGVMYMVWNLICYGMNGFFPYSFQDKLGLLGIVVYPLFVVFLMLLYYIGKWLSNRIWNINVAVKD